jgi:hypothetical protein
MKNDVFMSIEVQVHGIIDLVAITYKIVRILHKSRFEILVSYQKVSYSINLTR